VISIATGATLEYSSSSAQTLSGIISGAGQITKDTGTSTLTLTGANTYSGDTTINAGTLQFGGAGGLGSGSYAGAIAIASGTTLEYSSSTAQTLSGVISGAGQVTKDSSASTLTLSGANTYLGTTTVNAGTLELSGSLNVGSGNTAMVAVASGATLSGAGVITAGTLSLSGAGTVSLTGSNAVGTLAASGALGTVTFNDAHSLSVGAITATSLAISTTGASSNGLTLSGALATGSGGNAGPIVLSAAGSITATSTVTTQGQAVSMTS
jgi:autotransporter-associated beta strand protein